MVLALAGKSPPQLGNLSKLNYLDIGFPTSSVDNLLWLSQLSSLAYLDMSWGWNLSSASDWLESLNMLASLEELKLVCTDLPSTNLNSLSQSNFKVLSKIDLSLNNLNSTFPYWLTNVQTVAYIDLSYCGLYGSIPEAIGNLSALRELSLSTNSLEGTIPISIGRLCELQHLDLSKNNLAGDIDNFGKAMDACMKELFSINLGTNNLSGSIPRWLGSFRKLSSVDLSNNSLTGHVPSNINQLTNLIHLDISSNFLQGVLSEEHLANLSILSTLSMSSNSLRISVGTNWVPPFQLIELQLYSCPLESQFPQWLQTQTSIWSLDLHNTGTKGPLPSWIWTSLTSLVSLDLSNNQITGKLPASLEHRSLEVLDLSNNSFSGSLPSSLGSNNLHFVFLSNNHLNGSIPMYFCDMEFLSTMDLSNNSFSGELPNQWNNDLEGGIPSSIGSLTSLSSLRLSRNKLSGVLPDSLSSCNSLILIDLGENHFEGPIPSWIGDALQILMILRLRSNQFSGNIPAGLSQLLGLQVLDLASNKLSGHVPQSIGNFTFMASQNGTSYYYYSVYVTIKGEERLYSRILDLMKSIDLSDNDLTGEIPVEIGALVGLKNLNMSRNLLHGHIPDTLGSMGSLESLDLSWNQLSGAIPQSMTSLHLLSHLNMSYNNLSGKIPVGSQLQTLGDEDPYIYAGNSYLCSALSNYSCSAHNQCPIDYEEDMYDHDVLLYVFSGLGFGLGFAAVWWLLIFNKGIHKWYFLSIDSMFEKSCDWMMVLKVKVREIGITSVEPAKTTGQKRR
ncbi:hypothetical protein HU200_015131 [Digitaria exilis]|uniref:Uncharacterized protein n=1 Tax=Digitaria exilis TaxID=1010633 RepID=A0A835KI66_9POAL|nr:hypothetical protein HU200_015131 [Digitaria exilis]